MKKVLMILGIIILTFTAKAQLVVKRIVVKGSDYNRYSPTRFTSYQLVMEASNGTQDFFCNNHSFSLHYSYLLIKY